jgi:hypothetical protein
MCGMMVRLSANFVEREVSAKADKMKNNLEKCLKHTVQLYRICKIINNANELKIE